MGGTRSFCPLIPRGLRLPENLNLGGELILAMSGRVSLEQPSHVHEPPSSVARPIVIGGWRAFRGVALRRGVEFRARWSLPPAQQSGKSSVL